MLRTVVRPLLSLGPLQKGCIGIPVRYRHQGRAMISSKDVAPITIQQARERLKDLVGTMCSTDTERAVNGGRLLPIKRKQEECPVRAMTDSYLEVIIPLAQDPEVRLRYITCMRGLRFGRVLEDLDTLAGVISYTHNQDENRKSPHLNVTALLDRIDLYDVTLSPYKDVWMSGHVTWVGRTSMEVTMIVEQEMDGKREQVLTARFLMVARDLLTEKAAVVNGLKPATELEKALFDHGGRNRQLRQESSQKSLLKTAPNEEERNIIHRLFLETIDEKSGTYRVRVKPKNSVWMRETMLKSLRICHPEQKNVHNKIFGGFLMRQAFELAWANAALYCKTRPVVRVVDDIAFRQPVEIGSLLFLSSQIVYTEGALMQVKVHAEVVDLPTGSHDTTNDFYFVFDSNRHDLPRIAPKTYSESMLFLDGMRHMRK